MKRCSPDCLCLLGRVLSAFALRPVRFTCVNLCARTQSALRHICITRVRACVHYLMIFPRAGGGVCVCSWVVAADASRVCELQLFVYVKSLVQFD